MLHSIQVSTTVQRATDRWRFPLRLGQDDVQEVRRRGDRRDRLEAACRHLGEADKTLEHKGALKGYQKLRL